MLNPTPGPSSGLEIELWRGRFVDHATGGVIGILLTDFLLGRVPEVAVPYLAAVFLVLLLNLWRATTIWTNLLDHAAAAGIGFLLTELMHNTVPDPAKPFVYVSMGVLVFYLYRPLLTRRGPE